MDVTKWTSPETHFAWPHVQAAIDRIDSTVYRIAIEIAHDLLLDGARDCPSCARPAADLDWFSVSSPAAEWEAGNGRVGFLTLCSQCQTQIDFLVDDELTEFQAEEFRKTGYTF